MTAHTKFLLLIPTSQTKKPSHRTRPQRWLFAIVSRILWGYLKNVLKEVLRYYLFNETDLFGDFFIDFVLALIEDDFIFFKEIVAVRVN